jgi:ParB family chromosome partitioning protein
VKPTRTAITVPLDRICASATNPRKHFDAEELDSLASTIKERGILQPVIVRPKGDGYELVAGERRYRAAGIAKLDAIPAVVRDLDDMAALEVQVIENDQRADLTPIEKAQGYKALLDQGYTMEALAEKIGRKPNTIYALLKLLNLPETAQAAVRQGKLKASTAALIGRIPTAKAREEATAAIVNGGVTHREAVTLVHNRFKKSATSPAQIPPPPKSRPAGKGVRRLSADDVAQIAEGVEYLRQLHANHPHKQALDEALGEYLAKVRG